VCWVKAKGEGRTQISDEETSSVGKCQRKTPDVPLIQDEYNFTEADQRRTAGQTWTTTIAIEAIVAYSADNAFFRRSRPE